MNFHAPKLLSQLEDQLNSIAKTETAFIKQIELSCIACNTSLTKLKDLVIKLKFKKEEDEIHFFKYIKPKFSSKLYYFFLLYDLERRRIYQTGKSQEQYLETWQVKIETYYQSNFEFCNYFRTDSTFHDNDYFLRSRLNLHLAYTETFFNYDCDFSTNRDSHVAHIMANDLLSNYIQKELQKIHDAKAIPKLQQKSNLHWTDTKASLIVLIYALHSASSFNNGNAELKEIANTFCKSFNIDTGDIYRTWSELKLRKDPAKFLDLLKMAIENKINEDMM